MKKSLILSIVLNWCSFSFLLIELLRLYNDIPKEDTNNPARALAIALSVLVFWVFCIFALMHLLCVIVSTRMALKVKNDLDGDVRVKRRRLLVKLCFEILSICILLVFTIIFNFDVWFATAEVAISVTLVVISVTIGLPKVTDTVDEEPDFKPTYEKLEQSE